MTIAERTKNRSSPAAGQIGCWAIVAMATPPSLSAPTLLRREDAWKMPLKGLSSKRRHARRHVIGRWVYQNRRDALYERCYQSQTDGFKSALRLLNPSIRSS